MEQPKLGSNETCCSDEHDLNQTWIHFDMHSTDKVTSKLTNAVKCEQLFLLAVREDHGRPMDTAHLELCRQQHANN